MLSHGCVCVVSSERKYDTRALKLLKEGLTSTFYSNLSEYSNFVSVHVFMLWCSHSVKPCYCLRAHAVCLYLAFDVKHYRE